MEFNFVSIHPDADLAHLRYTIHKLGSGPEQLVIYLSNKVLDQAGIDIGDRLNIAIDLEENLGLIEKHTSLGWILKGITDSRNYSQLIFVWRPESGFPHARNRVELDVLHADAGQIIFKMPTTDRERRSKLLKRLSTAGRGPVTNEF